MREVQASEAKTHLPRLLDEVERGETFIITRHGRAIARIVPEVDEKREDMRRAIAEVKAARKGSGRITVEEILSARDEGAALVPYVLDASVTACWAFDDENDILADIALDRLDDDYAFVPTLWQFEIRNTLIVNERRGRKSVAESTVFLSRLARFPILIDRSPEDSDLMTLARRHGLTVYDAAYLELARRRREPLATLDKKLAAAATAESVALMGAT